MSGKRLHNLQALLCTHRKIGYIRSRLENQTRLCADLPYARRRPCRSVATPKPAITERNVLRNGQRGNQGEMLVHHPNASGDGVRATAPHAVRAGERNHTIIGAQFPKGNAHERALSGAVFTEQCVHRSSSHFQRCTIERERSTEAL